MSDCIEWQGYRSAAGYGMKGSRASGKFKLQFVHRLEYEAHHGAIPDGLCVLHTCDNPPCYNINHLWLGTIADNNADKHQKGRGHWATGSKHGRSKLTETQVREIKVLLSMNQLTIVGIAKLYHVTNMA